MRNFFCEQLAKPLGDLSSVPLLATLPTATLPLGDKDSRNGHDFKAYEWQWLHNPIQAFCPLERPTDTWELKRAVLPDSPTLSVPRLVHLWGNSQDMCAHVMSTHGCGHVRDAGACP